MASNTYVALKTTTVTGSAAASVTLSSIPSTYTDLVIVADGTGSSNASYKLQFNGDTGANYSVTYMYGDGSSAPSGRASNQNDIPAMGRLGTSQGNGIMQIMNYSNTTTYKTVIGRGNLASQLTIAAVGLWRSTAAINSVTLTPEAGTISVGSTFTIYGVAAASVGAKATGGIISQDANYFYHTFIGNGTFTPSQSLTCDYLVVAGGGGGRAKIGGGGGAGGYRTTVGTSGGGGSAESAISLSNGTAYTITIGAGGSGYANGSDTSIAGSGLTTITSTGGGAGGYSSGSSGTNPISGGSGGGGAGPELSSGTMAGAAGTANQGYAGATGKSGSSSPTGWHMGAGGGGAGGVAPAITATTVLGGPGLVSSIDGIARGGGGGGGTQYGDSSIDASGGTGGGGYGGGYFRNPTNGTAYTGGGAGGGGYGGSADTATASGGSGVVVIRYAK